MASSLSDLYDAPSPVATPSPAPSAGAPKPKKRAASSGLNDLYGGGGSPLQGALHAGGAVLERLGVPKVIDLLDRPRQATQAGIAGHNPLDALIHGQSQEQQDANRAALRHKIGLDDPNSFLGKHGGTYQGSGQAERGFVDLALDTFSDPMTAIGGLGLLGKGARAGMGVARASGVPARLATTPIGKRAVEYGRAVGDAFTSGGSAKRELGDDTYHNAIAADNRQSAREPEAVRRLTARYEATLAKLPDAERVQVYQVLNGERDTRGMPQHLADAARAGRKLLNDAGALYADESGRRKLAYGGGRLNQGDVLRRMGRAPSTTPAAPRSLQDVIEAAKRAHGGGDELGWGIPKAAVTRRLAGRVDRPYDLPPELREFAAPADQGVLKASNVRRDYLPAPRSGEELVGEDVRPGPFNLLTPRATNAIRRDDFKVDPNDLSALDESFRGALAQAGRQGTAGRLRDEVGVRAGGNADPALLRLFERQPAARGEARTTGEKALADWRNIVNIPKNTVTTMGLAHGLKNVPTLAALSEGPGAALEGLLGGARIAMTKDPAKKYDLLRPGREAGVIGASDVRENPIADTLARLPGIGPTIGKASQKANELTWAIDDASRQAVVKRKLARLGPNATQQDRTRAAAEALREMVDYRHRSKATEALGAVAPFATFRSRIPAAVASSVSRHPERALFADRASGGLASGGSVDIGDYNVSMSNPLSDVVGLAGQPRGPGKPFNPSQIPGAQYGRAMLADPLRALLSVPAGAVGMAKDENGKEPFSPSVMRALRYATYGQPILPHKDKDGKWKAGFLGQQAAGYDPTHLSGAALDAGGLGEYKPEDFLQQLLGGLFGLHVRHR